MPEEVVEGDGEGLTQGGWWWLLRLVLVSLYPWEYWCDAILLTNWWSLSGCTPSDILLVTYTTTTTDLWVLYIFTTLCSVYYSTTSTYEVRAKSLPTWIQWPHKSWLRCKHGAACLLVWREVMVIPIWMTQLIHQGNTTTIWCCTTYRHEQWWH